MPPVSFSPEQDSVLIELRSQRMSWPQIGDRLGRDPEACRSRFNRLVPKQDDRRATSRVDMWTDEETRMLDGGKTAPEIAVILGRSLESVKCKIRYRRVATVRVEIDEVRPRAVAPPECIAERERRHAAPRDLTAIFMGDPPKGYSALDRKLGATA